MQSSSILKSLLDAPDDDPDFQQMKQIRSPTSLKREDQEWKKHVGEALKQRRKTHYRRYMSRKERELR